MRIKLFLVALLVAMTSGMPAAVGNKEILTNDQYRLRLSLENMYWQENLSRDDVRKVIVALNSKKYELGKVAVIVVALHDLSETAPILMKGAGGYISGYKTLPKIFADAFARGIDPVAHLRAASIEETPRDRDLARAYNRMLAEEGLSLGEIVTSIIVITEARALRSGLKTEPDTDGRTLSSFNRRLLAYSAMDRPTAIADMLAQIAKVEGPRATNPREAARLLRSFGQDAVDAVLARLSSATVREEFSDRGIGILLDWVLRLEALLMNAETKQRTLRIISRIDTEGSSKLLPRQVESLRKILSR